MTDERSNSTDEPSLCNLARQMIDDELTQRELRAIREARQMSGPSASRYADAEELPAEIAIWPTGRLTRLGEKVFDLLQQDQSK